MNIVALLLTLGIGLFILIGSILVLIIPNHHKLVRFSIALAFGVMSGLVLLDLIPETYEHLSEAITAPWNIILLIVLATMGVLLLKLLDLWIPHHSHHHHEKEDDSKEHLQNLFHIGLVSSIAFVIHNMMEGMALYATAVSSFEMGLLLSLGIGLHNIPLGMVVTSTFSESHTSKKKAIAISIVLSLSTFLGGLVMCFFPFQNDLVLGIFFALTMGMLCYIILFELLPSLLQNKKDKWTILGIILGILIMVASMFLHQH